MTTESEHIYLLPAYYKLQRKNAHNNKGNLIRTLRLIELAAEYPLFYTQYSPTKNTYLTITLCNHDPTINISCNIWI